MSTHALIALMLDPGGRYVEAVYAHLDGGPARLGQLLLDHYNSVEAVEILLAGGDYHALRESVGLSERAHPPVAARDGELWLLARREAAEYVYLYDRGKDEKFGGAAEPGWWWSPAAERRLRPLTAFDTIPPHLRSADGVDAGSYTVSEPLTVESVTARALAAQPPASLEKVIALYRDVLDAIAADRYGPLGALARAALTAEESDR